MRVRTAALTILVAAAACFAHPTVDLGPTSPGVSVEATVAYYDVTANSLVDLRRALAQEGFSSQGRRWAAITSWRLAWTYQTRRGSLGCEIERTHVRVTTNITFPRWNPTSPPDSSLTAWWDQFNAGLAEHERGHAQLAVKAAGQIVKTFDGMSGDLCGALQQRATDVGTRLSSAMQSEQAEYDATTRHGQTPILKVTRLQTP